MLTDPKLKPLLFAQQHGLDNVYSTLMSTARAPVTGLRGVYSPANGRGIVDLWGS